MRKQRLQLNMKPVATVLKVLFLLSAIVLINYSTIRLDYSSDKITLKLRATDIMYINK
jgi:hypothetical protein